METTLDAEMTELARRLEALAKTQKAMFDSLLVLGLASGAWDVEDAAVTLRELADEPGISDSFVKEIASDARRMVMTLDPPSEPQGSW